MAYKNKTDELEYHKRYYTLNKERKQEYKRRVYSNNKEYQKEWSRVKYSENKELYKNRAKEYGKKISARFLLLIRNSKKRGYEMTLTIDEFTDIVLKPCRYCGISDVIIGIDRENNEIGYTKSNSFPCCKICNMMKHAMSLDDFVCQIRRIHNNL